MGFRSGGDDLKDNAMQRYAGKPNVRHCFVYIRQVAPQIYANLRKKFQKIYGNNNSG